MTVASRLRIEEPDILDDYLDRWSGLVMLLLGPDDVIQDCNQAFLRLMSVPAPPVGRSVKDFLTSEGRDAVSRGTWHETPFVRVGFRSPQGEVHLLACRALFLGAQRLILGERLAFSNDEVLARIGSLNNELTNLARELQKKNAALEQANETITRLSRTDPLTGVANRRYFMERLPPAVSAARRHHLPLALVMADLDHFKAVNDTYGHDAGDEVLKAFGALLIRTSRAEDLAVRFGGEEFLVLLPNTAGRQASVFAERVRTALHELVIPGIDRRISASLGITDLRDEDTLETFMKRADEALYEAKHTGRDRWVAR